jgi:DNA gyrase subunit A
VYWLKVYEVPEVSAAGKGKAIANLVALQPGESVRAWLAVRDLEEEKYVFFATRNGDGEEDAAEGLQQAFGAASIAIPSRGG